MLFALIAVLAFNAFMNRDRSAEENIEPAYHLFGVHRDSRIIPVRGFDDEGNVGEINSLIINPPDKEHYAIYFKEDDPMIVRLFEMGAESPWREINRQ